MIKPIDDVEPTEYLGPPSDPDVILRVDHLVKHFPITRGILFKNSEALERAHSLRAIVLDKTGTITVGEPSVTDIVTTASNTNRVSENDLLRLAASAERGSEHPLGEAIVRAAQARGLKYLAVTDHSQRVRMARGLDAKRLRQQWKEIDRLNEELDDFLVLKGIECDILEKGGMDLPDDVLAEADWVVASVHYGQQQPREQITERLLGALENSHVSVIAHPTGRLINRREPYAVDLDRVFAAAAHCGTTPSDASHRCAGETGGGVQTVM